MTEREQHHRKNYTMYDDNKSHSDNDYKRYVDSNVPHRCITSTYPNHSFSHNKANNYPSETLEKATRALSCIPNNLPRKDWLKIATALKTEFGSSAKQSFLDWSDTGSKLDRQNAKDTWKSAVVGSIKINTLYYYARRYGYKEQSSRYVSEQEQAKRVAENEKRKEDQKRREEQDRLKKQQANKRAIDAINDVLPCLVPASRDSTIYLKNRWSNGFGAYLLSARNLQGFARYTYPFNQIKKTALVIPFQDHHGVFVGAQCIYGGKKRLVKGSISKGSYAYLGAAPLPSTDSIVYIGEGYATVNTAIQSDSNSFGVMAKDANNLPAVASSIRDRHPNAQIIILGDNDKSGEGQKQADIAAKQCNGIVAIPEWMDGQAKSTDWNDVHRRYGIGAFRYCLHKIKNNEPINNLALLVEGEGKYATINIDQQYLGSSIARAMEAMDVKFIIVKSGMKTGKTTAGKKMIVEANGGNFLVITSRENLNLALASELGLNFYQDVKLERDKKVRGELAKRMAITPNSLPKILSDFPDIAYNTIFIDESETAAAMLVSDATNKKAQTLDALKTAAKHARKVVLMDAHANTRTEKLMDILSHGNKVGYLVNNYKPWSDTQVQVIISHKGKGKAKDEKRAIKSAIIDDIRIGKKPYICSTSKKFCREIEEDIKKLFPNVPCLLIESKTKNNPDVISVMKDTSKATLYNVIIGSPSINVGVSFDDEHFDTCYAHLAPNNDSTGDPWDAMQAVARPRRLKDKTWVITLPHEQLEPYRNAPSTPKDITDAIEYRIKTNIKAAGRPISLATSTELEVAELYATCSHIRYQSKNNFNHIFRSLLDEMGCRVHDLDASVISTTKKEEIATNVVKRKMKILDKVRLQTGIQLDDSNYDKANEAIKSAGEDVSMFKALEDRGIIPVGGRKLTDSEYQQAVFDKTFNKANADQSMIAAIDRYKLEHTYGVDCEKLKDNAVEMSNVLMMDENSAAQCCIRREKAQADSPFSKRYTGLLLCGTEKDKAFKADIISSKLNFELERKMYAYAMPYIDGKRFNGRSLKRGGMVQWFKRNEKHINALRLLPMPKNWQKKPNLLMKALLKKMGLEISKERQKGQQKYKREWLYFADSKKNAAINNYYDFRQKNGMNWVLNTKYIMTKYEGVVGYAISEKELIEYKLKPRSINIIADALKFIPIKRHEEIMNAYKTLIRLNGYNSLIADKAITEESYQYIPDDHDYDSENFYENYA